MTGTAKKWLSERLAQLRALRGLTQEALAEKAGISYKYYQAIEAGRKRDLRLSTLEKLAKAHQLSLSTLLAEEPSPRLADKKAPGTSSTKASKKVSYRRKK